MFTSFRRKRKKNQQRRREYMSAKDNNGQKNGGEWISLRKSAALRRVQSSIRDWENEGGCLVIKGRKKGRENAHEARGKGNCKGAAEGV